MPEFKPNATATYEWIQKGREPKIKTMPVRATPKFFMDSIGREWDREGHNLQYSLYGRKKLLRVVADDGTVLYERSE